MKVGDPDSSLGEITQPLLRESPYFKELERNNASNNRPGQREHRRCFSGTDRFGANDTLG
ncbi:MAG: hypothetical protein JJU13_08005 [Balneolaceae bacterium]|nr:hypothetical protein [Balneolaceae bacterium]